MNSTMKTSMGTVLVVALQLAGCANFCVIEDPSTGEPIPGEFAGTIGNLAKPKTLPDGALLVDVKTATCEGFDRVVFEFEGAEAPGFFSAYIDKPVRQCGSGNVVPVAGDGWLEIRMTPASAHTEEGQATISDRNRTLNDPNLFQLVQTCDFEGNVTWVMGVGSPEAYRVVELTSPPRLIVDVKHGQGRPEPK